jgi:cytosine/uracil/thiamine/allantoin permease
MEITAQGEEVRLPDGRVTLADPGRVGDKRYTNGDLAPVPIERRTWNRCRSTWAANTVAPSYDFSNLMPRLSSFRTGSLADHQAGCGAGETSRAP